MNNKIDHKGTIQLESNRIILRRLTLKDATSMYNNWASDEEVTKYLTWPAHSNIGVTKMVLNSWIEQYDNNEFYQWGIVFKDENELIGTIGVVNKNDDIKSFELGVCLGKKYWGKAIGPEAVNIVIKYLKQIGYTQMTSTTKVGNKKSFKAIINDGSEYIGIKKDGCTNLDKTKSDIHVFRKKL